MFLRNNIWFIFILLLLSQCKGEKEHLINIETNNVSHITSSTAMGGGYVFLPKTGQILSRGICWDTTPQPTLAGSHSTDGKGNGHFNSVLSDLKPDTDYFVRSYVKTDNKTHYGRCLTFKTTQEFQLLCNTTIDSIVNCIAFLKCIPGVPIHPDFDEFGFCWDTMPNPTIENET